MSDEIRALDLESTYLGLAEGPDVRVVPVGPDFWPTIHENEDVVPRMVAVFAFDASWNSWEMHPLGEEVVVLLDGAVDMHFEVAEGTKTLALEGGETVIVPRGVWHTLDVREAGRSLHITWGERTEHRSR